MARPIFWPTDGSYCLGYGGMPYAAVPVRIYTRQTGGTQVTDLVTVAADGTLGAAIPSGILISDQNGLIPAFAGPDSGPTTLWGDHGYDAQRLALTCDPTGVGGGGGAVTSVVSQTGAITGTQILADSTVAAALTAKAPLASPALTGTPTVPTAAVDTATTQAASTAYVIAQAASAAPLINGSAAAGTSTRTARGDHVHPTDTTRLASGATAGGDLSGTLPSPTVAKLNGISATGTPAIGDVLTATSTTAATWSAPAAGAGDATTGAKGVVQLAGDLAGTAAAPTVAKINGVAVTGTPSTGMVPTATSGTAATWQAQASAPVTTVAGRTGAIVLAEADITNLVTDLAAKAPLASPALTGSPTSGGSAIATAASVATAVSGLATLASPALTGTPTAPTAAVDTSTTQVASTAFVVAQAGSATPLIDGTATVGTSTRYARDDHKHPTDTTRAATATTITAGTGLTGGGDLSTNRTLTVAYGTTSTTATIGNDTRVVNAVQSTTILAIVQLTQAAYDALSPPVSTTLYVIVG